MVREGIWVSDPRRPRYRTARQESRPLQSGAAEPWDLAAGVNMAARWLPRPTSPVHLFAVRAECVFSNDPVQDNCAY